MTVLITDVAKLAGVSISTVSRVLNNNGYPVKESVRKKVLIAAQQLDYIPNKSAKSLRQKTKNGIALIVRNISDPYFTDIEKGVTENAVRNSVIATVFNSMQDTEFELNFYNMISEQQYAGLIIGCGAFGGKRTNQRLEMMVRQLQRQGCKVVALAPQGFDVPTISVDNISVGHLATSKLISLNHKKIAYIGGSTDHLVDVGRFNGYQKALKDSGINLNESLVFTSEYSVQAGYANCRKLLDSGEFFSAIYCSNDHIAIGVVQCLKENNIKVPKDVSVIGTGGFYSDLPYHIENDISTIKFPFYQLGKRSVELILENKELDNDYREILEVSLLEKKTTSSIE